MRERFADLSKPTCAEKFLDGVDKFCITFPDVKYSILDEKIIDRRE